MAEHQTLLDRIPRVKDLQSVWLLLWHCVSACDNYQIRFVDPALLSSLRLTIMTFGSASVANWAHPSGCRSRVPAHWASWADCTPMIFERRPMVVERLLRQLEGHPTTPCLCAATSAAEFPEGVLGWSPPSWTVLANGERPDSHLKNSNRERVVVVGITKQAEVQRRGTVCRVG